VSAVPFSRSIAITSEGELRNKMSKRGWSQSRARFASISLAVFLSSSLSSLSQIDFSLAAGRSSGRDIAFAYRIPICKNKRAAHLCNLRKKKKKRKRRKKGRRIAAKKQTNERGEEKR